MPRALCSMPYAHDHFRNRQLDPSGQTGCLLELIFEAGHLDIKLRAIKFEVGFIGTAFIKSAASRAMDNRLSGFMKLMRDTVQPADHRAIVVKGAHAIKI